MLPHLARLAGVGRYWSSQLVVTTAGAPHAESRPGWLDRLNLYRATAALPPVVEEAVLSGPILQHARYMVQHDVVQHSQNLRHRDATSEGAARDAVVLIPRQPLRPGTSYRVIVEVNHRRIDWTFGVAGV